MTFNERPKRLQSFLDAMRVSFDAAAPDPQTVSCVDRVFSLLEQPGPVLDRDDERAPASAFLPEALEPALSAGGHLALLASHIAELNRSLVWRRRNGEAPNASPSYPEGHANALIVGPGAMEDRPDIWIGLSLLAPGVRYPDHRHPPEEAYLVLTEGEFRQGDGDWFAPGTGGTLYNDPNILHAMRSAPSTPFLALWCLPIETGN